MKLVQQCTDKCSSTQVTEPHALQRAIAFEDWERVNALIVQNADLQECGEFYGDPLSAAAYTCVTDCNLIRLLLERGTSPNCSGGERYGPPLTAACCRGNIAAMKLLLDAEANPNAQGGRHHTALQSTVVEGCFRPTLKDEVKLLLDYGADPTICGGEYFSPLTASLLFCDETSEVPELLLRHTLYRLPGRALLDDAIQIAAARGRKNIVHELYTAGADPNVLPWAAEASQVRLISYLLDRGADINRTNDRYGTALQAAISHGSTECVEFLIDRGADIHLTGGKYGNALQAAAYSGDTRLIKYLVLKGADPKAGFGEYGQPLQAAVYTARGDVVELLLDSGVEINAVGGDRGSALQAACEEGSLEIVNLLLKRGANPNLIGGGFISCPLVAAVRVGNVDIVKLLLDKGADPGLLTGERTSPLSEAQYWGRTEITKLLEDAWKRGN